MAIPVFVPRVTKPAFGPVVTPDAATLRKMARGDSPMPIFIMRAVYGASDVAININVGAIDVLGRIRLDLHRVCGRRNRSLIMGATGAEEYNKTGQTGQKPNDCFFHVLNSLLKGGQTIKCGLGFYYRGKAYDFAEAAINFESRVPEKRTER